MPIVTLLTAPFFATRSKISNASRPRLRLDGLARTPQQIHQLLKASIPVVSPDTVEISVIARRRARGERSWIPEDNSFQRLLTRQQKIVQRSNLEQLQRHNNDIRRRLWNQAIRGGTLVQGPPSYEYIVGADQRLYAVSGSLSVDTSPVPEDPIATKRKAGMVRDVYLGTTAPRVADYRSAQSAISMGIDAGIALRSKAVGASTPLTQERTSPAQTRAVSEKRLGQTLDAPPVEPSQSRIAQLDQYRRTATVNRPAPSIAVL